MSVLDELGTYKELDPADMLGRIGELPRECQRAWSRGMNLALLPHYGNVDKVLILGMGGSAIGGDLLASLAATEGAVPVFVCRDYELPSFVDGKTLVIASSYSGMTEETLSSFSQALATPAKKIALTTGGKLGKMAAERFIPLLTIKYRSQPRAALAYSFISLVAIMHNLGLISDKSKNITETYRVLEGLRARFDVPIPLRRNPAKELATRLFGRLAIIYGAGFLSEVARRWKTQINENSKAWAFFEVFPELNHNSVVGYEFPLEVGRRAFIVLLHSPKLHLQILKRYEATSELLAQRGIEHQIMDAEGESILCQMMSLIFLGDYVSYYLALLYKVDPTPVEAIDLLKKKLAGD